MRTRCLIIPWIKWKCYDARPRRRHRWLQQGASRENVAYFFFSSCVFHISLQRCGCVMAIFAFHCSRNHCGFLLPLHGNRILVSRLIFSIFRGLFFSECSHFNFTSILAFLILHNCSCFCFFFWSVPNRVVFIISFFFVRCGPLFFLYFRFFFGFVLANVVISCYFILLNWVFHTVLSILHIFHCPCFFKNFYIRCFAPYMLFFAEVSCIVRFISNCCTCYHSAMVLYEYWL